VKVCVSDQLPAQRAAGRDIAFNDVHAALPTLIEKSPNFRTPQPE
jgi:hypothetical protein